MTHLPNRRPARGVRPVSTALVPLLAALALAACSDPAGERGSPEAPASATPIAPDTGPPASPPATTGETVGGDGSAIVLNGLTGDEVDSAGLSGELACAFVGEGDQILLHAKGVVASSEPAQGVVKVGDYVERVGAPGGFDGILRGATFAGRGKTVVIEVTGAPIGRGESPPNPATLTYQRADGASRVFNGLWTCGP
ncbi:MAG: hypothetical protein Q7S93_18785 [Phenylobacterium sp.]|uniref:hypothetical protein n=1 Tax=Phenylobacterium sp. TaxID=1871053 RepID=UPI0027291FD3|nr:hypothetical protein [Phenylobacterium sp.]MDO8412104.1 hypothetical protein [Phenylobacterium sp.]